MALLLISQYDSPMLTSRQKGSILFFPWQTDGSADFISSPVRCNLPRRSGEFYLRRFFQQALFLPSLPAYFQRIDSPLLQINLSRAPHSGHQEILVFFSAKANERELCTAELLNRTFSCLSGQCWCWQAFVFWLFLLFQGLQHHFVSWRGFAGHHSRAGI